MDKSSRLTITNLKLLLFLLINAQCYINEKSVLTDMDRDASKYAQDLIIRIRRMG